MSRETITNKIYAINSLVKPLNINNSIYENITTETEKFINILNTQTTLKTEFKKFNASYFVYIFLLILLK